MHAAARRFALVLLVSAALCAQRDVVELTIRVSEAGSEVHLEQVRVELVRFPDEVLSVRFTDSTGSIVFSGLRIGPYLLRFSKTGYENAEARIELRRGEHAHNEEFRLSTQRARSQNPAGEAVSARELAIPESARKEFQKGLELLNKDPKASLPRFQKAADLYPGYYEAHFGMGMAYVQLKSNAEALAALTKAIDLNPKFLPPYYPLAILLMSQKRHQEVEPWLRRAMELDPKNWQYPFELARSLGNQAKWAEAIKLAELAGSKPNAASRVHLLLADLYSGHGNTERAIQELETFLKLDPQSPYVPVVKKSLEKLRSVK